METVLWVSAGIGPVEGPTLILAGGRRSEHMREWSRTRLSTKLYFSLYPLLDGAGWWSGEEVRVVPGDRLLSGALLFLRRAEIRIVSGGPTDLDLVVPGGGTVAVKVKVFGRPPTPTIVEGLRDGHRDDRFLLFTPRATSYLRGLAAEGEVDLIAVEEGCDVIGSRRAPTVGG